MVNCQHLCEYQDLINLITCVWTRCLVVFIVGSIYGGRQTSGVIGVADTYLKVTIISSARGSGPLLLYVDGVETLECLFEGSKL